MLVMLHAVGGAEAIHLGDGSLEGEIGAKASLNEVPNCLSDQLIILVFNDFLTANEVLGFQHFGGIHADIFVKRFEQRFVVYWARVASVEVFGSDHLLEACLICSWVSRLAPVEEALHLLQPIQRN